MKKILLIVTVLALSNLSFAQYTAIPDFGFEAALDGLGYDDIPGDNQVPTANISGVTTLDVSGMGIFDLSGIQDFISLEELYASNNALFLVDVTQNVNLIVLELQFNALAGLDVTQNTNLAHLDVNNNQLIALDVSQNTQLESLNCSHNQIITLDLTQNTSLTTLIADNGQLSTLDMRNGTNGSITTFNTVSNPSLTCIKVDNVAYSTANWTNIDGTTSFSLDCIPCTNTFSTDVESACDSLVWIDGNTYYTSNNTAMHTVPNAAGCDSVITLDLTINQTEDASFDWGKGGSNPELCVNFGTFPEPENVGTPGGTYSALPVGLSFDVNGSVNTLLSTPGVYTFTYTTTGTCPGSSDGTFTIIDTTFSTDVQVACDSLVWIDGNTYYASNNTATHTVPNAAGCDSVITLDLTINQTEDASFDWGKGGTDPELCVNFGTWPEPENVGTPGGTYSALPVGLSFDANGSVNTLLSTPGVYTFTYTTTGTCPSSYDATFTIIDTTFSTDIHVVCDSLVWIDGNTYYASNNSATYLDQNAAGCDSVITLDLTVLNSSSSTDVQVACNSYMWMDGNNYTSSNNTATHTIPNAAGCDSVITLDLTINTVDTSVTQSGATLTSNAAGATYQWLDCNNSNAPIVGETNQNFNAPSNGSYAVEVTENSCTDTSACYTITAVGIDAEQLTNQVSVYPNPTKGMVNIDFGVTGNYTLEVMDASGRIVRNHIVSQGSTYQLELNEAVGIYFLRIKSGAQSAFYKLIKE